MSKDSVPAQKAIKAFRKAVYSPKTTIGAVRENFDALFGNPILPNNVDKEEITVGKIAADILTPEFAVGNFTVLYIHGGGFISGSRYAYRNFCASLAHESGCRLVLPEYPLAPEHPYPAALEDLYAVSVWLAGRTQQAGSVIFAGDGAGGNLALSLTHFLKSKNARLPAALVLFAPWADMACTTRKKDKKNPDPVFTPEILQTQALQYTFASNLTHPHISPLLGDFAGFPSLFIQCGSRDLLAEDCAKLAEKAEASGVNVTLDIRENLWHFFQAFDRATPEAGNAVTAAGKWIRALQKQAAEQ